MWSRDGIVPGTKIVYKLTKTGYAVEARLPAEAVAADVDARPGARVPFALGVNDADATGRREGQLYFPQTWRHSNPDTFATAVLADEQGRVPAEKPAQKTAWRDVQPLRGGTTGVRVTLDVKVQGGSGKAPATMDFTLSGDAPEVEITLDVATKTSKIGEIAPLPALACRDAKSFLVLAPYCDGLGIPVTDLSWRGRRWAVWGLDLPFIGLTDGKRGYMIIAEDPDDAVFRADAAKEGGATLLAPKIAWVGQKRQFGYARRARFCFFDQGGYVAICKRYRRYARDQGLLVTLKEKTKRKPHVARLAGAPDIWGNCSLAFCREAKAEGMDRLIVNGPSSREDMEAIKALGYLISVYDNYEDAMEGKSGRYGDFKTERDAKVLANGKLMKAWLTWDKKTQFMKRCSALFEQVARKWIPLDLAKHPYNARFIDVTTATSLTECYSDTHPLTRTDDRRVKRNLAKYVSHELGLVLGGEHGRWWGADLYDYWEGMQSGGFYSWPAGHVGINLPQKREDIGQRYLDWGLGEQHRLPIWELVFGDCVVSTWYWGDSTGHLYNVAPELAAKKDAYNILYGTVPLYWVSRPYGFNWSKPELRARLLESYRNTCKLHEVIGFEEMLSHEWLTPDKRVQRTKFADGTTVTVNFGEKAFPVEHQGKTYNLPQFGFLAQGPKVLIYKALEGKTASTYIRTPGYLFCDAAGAERDFEALRTDGRVTLRETDKGLWIKVESTKQPALVRPARLVRGWSPDGARLLALDDTGEPVGYADLPREGTAVRIPAGTSLLVYGKLAQKPDLAIEAGTVRTQPAQLAQGKPGKIRVEVRNEGTVTAKRTGVALYLGAPTAGELLETVPLSLPAGGSKEIAFNLPMDRLDGPRSFTIVADPEDKLVEFVEVNNRAKLAVDIAPNYALWPYRQDISVTVGEAAVSDWSVSAEVDLSAKMTGSKPNVSSVRVAELGADGRPDRLMLAQFEPREGGAAQGRVVWIMAGETPAGATRRFRLLWDKEGGHEFTPWPADAWDEQEQWIEMPAYRAHLLDGQIDQLILRHEGAPKTSIWQMLLCSSGDTGWGKEQGEVERQQVVAAGPVRTVIRVTKNLVKGYRYTKTYEFYPQYFVVEVSGNKPTIWSRAFYALEGQYVDDKGNKALMDGKGEAENVAGKNGNPQWYAILGDGWAHSCVALSPFDNISYWDGGNKGQIGFTSGKLTGHRIAYVMHPPQKDAAFAAADYQRLTQPIKVEMRSGGPQ